jgi:DNA-binding protein HU-beta
MEEALGSLQAVATAELAAGGKISLSGFGSFSVRTAKPRTLRVPATGEVVLIGERPVAKFKASRRLTAIMRASLADGGLGEEQEEEEEGAGG